MKEETIKLENSNYKKIYYYDTKETKISSEYYFYNKKYIQHRTDGPAVIWYYDSKEIKIERERYYINGKRHRTDGPAEIWYYKSGEISCELYYINNIEYSKEEFDKIKNINRNLKLLNKV